MSKIYLLIAFVTVSVCACSTSKISDTDLYKSDEERYASNIVVKEQTFDKIVYEYKDVRIDEIASLAAKHCNKEGLRAVLAQTALFRNNRMRATFVCEGLQ